MNNYSYLLYIDKTVYCDFDIYCEPFLIINDLCNSSDLDLSSLDRSELYCTGMNDCSTTCQCEECPTIEPTTMPTLLPSTEPVHAKSYVPTTMPTEPEIDSSSTMSGDTTIAPQESDNTSLLDLLLDPSAPEFYYFVGGIVAFVLLVVIFLMCYYTKHGSIDNEKNKSVINVSQNKTPALTQSPTASTVTQSNNNNNNNGNGGSSAMLMPIKSMSPQSSAMSPTGTSSHAFPETSPRASSVQKAVSSSSNDINNAGNHKSDSNLAPNANRRVTVNYGHNSILNSDNEDNESDSSSTSSSNAVAAAVTAQIQMVSQRNLFNDLQRNVNAPMSKMQANPKSVSNVSVKRNDKEEDSDSSSSSSAEAQAKVEAHIAAERYKSIDMGHGNGYSSMQSDHENSRKGMNKANGGGSGRDVLSEPAFHYGDARVRSSTEIAQQQNVAQQDVKMVGEIGGVADSDSDDALQLQMNINNRLPNMQAQIVNSQSNSNVMNSQALRNQYYSSHHNSNASMPPQSIAQQLGAPGAGGGMQDPNHRPNRSSSFDGMGDLIAVLQETEVMRGVQNRAKNNNNNNNNNNNKNSINNNNQFGGVVLPAQPQVRKVAQPAKSEVQNVNQYNGNLNYLGQNQRNNNNNNNNNNPLDRYQASPYSGSQKQAFANLSNKNSPRESVSGKKASFDNFSLAGSGSGSVNSSFANNANNYSNNNNNYGNNLNNNNRRNSQASQHSQAHSLLGLNNSNQNKQRISKVSVASQSSFAMSSNNSVNLSIISNEDQNHIQAQMNANEPGMQPGMQPGMEPGMQPGMQPGMGPGADGNEVKINGNDEDADIDDLYNDDLPELGQVDMRGGPGGGNGANVNISINMNSNSNNNGNTTGGNGSKSPRGIDNNMFGAQNNVVTPVGGMRPPSFNQNGGGEGGFVNNGHNYNSSYAD